MFKYSCTLNPNLQLVQTTDLTIKRENSVPQLGSEEEVRSHYQFQTSILLLVASIAQLDSFLM
jgi:hypothetical protein